MEETYPGAFKSTRIELTYPKAVKSTGIGLLHSIMRHTYPGTFKSTGYKTVGIDKPIPALFFLIFFYILKSAGIGLKIRRYTSSKLLVRIVPT